jgi:hypothetical protein
MSEHARWLIGTVIAVAGLVIGLLAWQFPKAPPAAAPTVSSTSAAVTSSPRPSPKAAVQNVALTDVQVGECLGGPSMAKIISSNFNLWPDSVEAVPCNVSHVAEVFFARNNLSASQANNQWQTLCDTAFKAYVGVSTGDSIYTYWTNSTQVSSGYSLQCIAFDEISTKPGYKTLDRSLKGIRQ